MNNNNLRTFSELYNEDVDDVKTVIIDDPIIVQKKDTVNIKSVIDLHNTINDYYSYLIDRYNKYTDEIFSIKEKMTISELKDYVKNADEKIKKFQKIEKKYDKIILTQYEYDATEELSKFLDIINISIDNMKQIIKKIESTINDENITESYNKFKREIKGGADINNTENIMPIKKMIEIIDEFNLKNPPSEEKMDEIYGTITLLQEKFGDVDKKLKNQFEETLNKEKKTNITQKSYKMIDYSRTPQPELYKNEVEYKLFNKEDDVEKIKKILDTMKKKMTELDRRKIGNLQKHDNTYLDTQDYLTIINDEENKKKYDRFMREINRTEIEKELVRKTLEKKKTMIDNYIRSLEIMRTNFLKLNERQIIPVSDKDYGVMVNTMKKAPAKNYEFKRNIPPQNIKDEMEKFFRTIKETFDPLSLIPVVKTKIFYIRETPNYLYKSSSKPYFTLAPLPTALLSVYDKARPNENNLQIWIRDAFINDFDKLFENLKSNVYNSDTDRYSHPFYTNISGLVGDYKQNNLSNVNINYDSLISELTNITTNFQKNFFDYLNKVKTKEYLEKVNESSCQKIDTQDFDLYRTYTNEINRNIQMNEGKYISSINTINARLRDLHEVQTLNNSLDELIKKNDSEIKLFGGSYPKEIHSLHHTSFDYLAKIYMYILYTGLYSKNGSLILLKTKNQIYYNYLKTSILKMMKDNKIQLPIFINKSIIKKFLEYYNSSIYKLNQDLSDVFVNLNSRLKVMIQKIREDEIIKIDINKQSFGDLLIVMYVYVKYELYC